MPKPGFKPKTFTLEVSPYHLNHAAHLQLEIYAKPSIFTFFKQLISFLKNEDGYKLVIPVAVYFPAKKVPPSKPEVRQLSDTSVMLNWTVPENEGLQITFFRVQYKRVGAGSKKGKWETEDAEIKSHVRTFEVGGLKPCKF